MPIHEPEWKDACAVIGEVVLLYSALDHQLERVARIRNGACHTPLVPHKASGKLEFAPVAATKLLKSLKLQDTKNYSFERVTIDQIREIIPVAEKALGGGEDILRNFAKVRGAQEQKKAAT